MDGNKDEALRCIEIAKAALASCDKRRALKFIKIAQRLDHTISVEDLISAAEKLDSDPSSGKPLDDHSLKKPPYREFEKFPNGNQKNYSDDHVRIVREIRRCKCHYAILGLEKSCSADQIRRAYRKLSLKVHPDKNNAPRSEDAFKMVCKAFKCLSNEESRRKYDQVGFVEEFEQNDRPNVRRRQARSAGSRVDVDFERDEIFRSFFFGSQRGVYRNANVYRADREMRHQPRRNADEGVCNLMALIQILPILIILLVAFLPFSELDYSLQKTYSDVSLQKSCMHQIPKITDEYGVEFYVKSDDFDHQFPVGTRSRLDLEHHVLREYKTKLRHYCYVEMQRRRWSRSYPTPHCDKLQDFGVA